MEYKIIPVIFEGCGKYGDFEWMIQQEEFKDSLFLFNENVESFYNGYRKPGKGNAVIRPYMYKNPVRAMPIPTGYMFDHENIPRGGFRKLNPQSINVIDDAFFLIKKELTRRKDIKRIFYSCDKEGNIGTNLFKVNKSVIKYITMSISNL